MQEYIRYSERFLETIGIFDTGSIWISVLKVFFYYGTLCTFYATGVVDLMTTMDNFNHFAENFAMLMIGLTGFMKFSILIYNRKKIRILRQVFINNEVSGQELKNNHGSIIDQYGQTGKIFARNYGWMVWAVTVGMVIQALPGVLLGHGLQLPFPAVYPFDLNSTALFAIAYCHQGVSSSFYFLVYVAHDTWFICMVHHACGNFCMLQNLLQKIADGDLEPEQVRKKIATCVRLHQNILKFSDDIEEVFNVSNLMQFLFTSVAMCTNGYAAMIMGLDEPQLLVKHFSALSGQIILLFIFNWCGQFMADKSLEVGHTISRSSFYKLNINHQKDLGLILLRAQKPSYLTAGKFTNLSLQNFTDLMKASASYFTMLRSVQET